jgi:hypothetical protein
LNVVINDKSPPTSRYCVESHVIISKRRPTHSFLFFDRATVNIHLLELNYVQAIRQYMRLDCSKAIRIFHVKLEIFNTKCNTKTIQRTMYVHKKVLEQRGEEKNPPSNNAVELLDTHAQKN